MEQLLIELMMQDFQWLWRSMCLRSGEKYMLKHIEVFLSIRIGLPKKTDNSSSKENSQLKWNNDGGDFYWNNEEGST